MFARVTLLEIDTTRTSVSAAMRLFEAEVLGELRARGGYRGVYVLATPDGKAALMSLWDREEQADTDGLDGFYTETLERFVTLFAAPPGRESYEVLLADAPVPDRS
jgi:hypothetical protein